MALRRTCTLFCTECGVVFNDKPLECEGYELRNEARDAGWFIGHGSRDYCPECVPTNGKPAKPAKSRKGIALKRKPAPLEDFGLALRELQNASDAEIAETAARPFRGRDKASFWPRPLEPKSASVDSTWSSSRVTELHQVTHA